MRNRALFPLLTVLLLVPTAASAQLRFQPPPPASRLDTRAPMPSGALRLVPVADTLRRRPSYWQAGWWTGVAVGALLGTAISVGNREGYPDSFGERVWASLVIGTAIGVPLGVIGGLIGDAFKKPVSAAPLSP